MVLRGVTLNLHLERTLVQARSALGWMLTLAGVICHGQPTGDAGTWSEMVTEHPTLLWNPASCQALAYPVPPVLSQPVRGVGESHLPPPGLAKLAVLTRGCLDRWTALGVRDVVEGATWHLTHRFGPV